MAKRESKSFVKSLKAMINILDNFISNVFLPWFLADLAFTLLPVIVIIFIQLSVSGETNYLYLSPEWSFASIVTCGLAITTAIELKMEYQRDHSHKVYSLTRLLILTLIASVVILVLVVLRDEGLQIDEMTIGLWQRNLLFFSILALFFAHFAKEEIKRKRNKLPKSLSKTDYFYFVFDSIQDICEELQYLQLAISKKDDIRYKGLLDEEAAYLKEENFLSELNFRIEKMELLYHGIMPQLKNYAASSDSSSNNRNNIQREDA